MTSLVSFLSFLLFKRKGSILMLTAIDAQIIEWRETLMKGIVEKD
jgi:hypothetical protein